MTTEFHFREPPSPESLSIVGTVSEFRFDVIDRLNRMPGFAVLTDCVPD